MEFTAKTGLLKQGSQERTSQVWTAEDGIIRNGKPGKDNKERKQEEKSIEKTALTGKPEAVSLKKNS